MICDRCGETVSGFITSYFNSDTICFNCKQKEQAHPMYEEARRKENEAVLAGDYNFPGIGLPRDLEGGG